VTTPDTGVAEEVVSRPTPELNPRNAAVAEIAARVAEQHAADAAESEELYGDKPAEKETAPELSEESEPEAVESDKLPHSRPLFRWTTVQSPNAFSTAARTKQHKP
jgi:hypothetical protein